MDTSHDLFTRPGHGGAQQHPGAGGASNSAPHPGPSAAGQARPSGRVGGPAPSQPAGPTAATGAGSGPKLAGPLPSGMMPPQGALPNGLPPTAPKAPLPSTAPFGGQPGNAGDHRTGADPAAQPRCKEEGGAAGMDMAGGVSPEDIQLVQNLIERCLQLYMTRDEVVQLLKAQASVEPGFTALVWQKLEEQNPEFFRCYFTRLKLKAQIVMFNHLLEQQVAVVQRMQRGWAAGGGSSSATASGIPLFQSSGGQQQQQGSGARPPPGDQAHRRQQPDHVVPGGGPGGSSGGGGGDFSFGMPPTMEGTGVSPLFSNLHQHIGNDEQDLAHLGQPMPTPTELQHSLAFLPQPSPLDTRPGLSGGSGPGAISGGAAGGGGMASALATLPRNFSLSDLGLAVEDRAPSLPRNFSMSELDAAADPVPH